MSSGKDFFSITYRFNFTSGEVKEFRVDIDSSTLIALDTADQLKPEWTKYGSFRCPNCPVNAADDEHCPVALKLEEIIRFFSDAASYEEVRLDIQTKERAYSKTTSMQDGVSGIIGILMVTSGCPVMGKLKPMVRFHMPFSTLLETEYRVMSMYMLAQFFRQKWGRNPDWQMKNLLSIYENIRILNQNVARRIASRETKDTSINSIVVLNNFADYVSVSIDEDMLHDIETLFLDYMDEE
ncbi:MAG: hypothetical protein WCJ01_05340 [Ignavibacteria bacterium]